MIPGDDAPPPADGGWQEAVWKLRYDWTPPYRIVTDQGNRWAASWLDAPAGGTMTAASADELRTLIRRDYARRTPEERQGWRLPHPPEITGRDTPHATDSADRHAHRR